MILFVPSLDYYSSLFPHSIRPAFARSTSTMQIESMYCTPVVIGNYLPVFWNTKPPTATSETRFVEVYSSLLGLDVRPYLGNLSGDVMRIPWPSGVACDLPSCTPTFRFLAALHFRASSSKRVLSTLALKHVKHLPPVASSRTYTARSERLSDEKFREALRILSGTDPLTDVEHQALFKDVSDNTGNVKYRVRRLPTHGFVCLSRAADHE